MFVLTCVCALYSVQICTHGHVCTGVFMHAGMCRGKEEKSEHEGGRGEEWRARAHLEHILVLPKP